MVKHLDKISYPPLEQHIGASLWKVSELWKERFDAEMVALGHAYFGEARSNILRYLRPGGTTQAEIVGKMGLSKQAVQQLLDDLVADGVVTRKPNPDDKRGNMIVLTQAGLRALHDANTVKRKIEKSYAKLIGSEKLAALVRDLDDLAEKLVEGS